MPGKYNFAQIEKKWQKIWRAKKVYEPDLKKAKKPFYNLMMFPYPSAEGLHVGNMYAFTGSDIYGRFMRMRGHDVFEPIGLDGFGIHSENYALKIGAHPMRHAEVSEKRFYKQLEMIGNGFAWNEKLETYDPAYYKWTQWIFTQLFKRGLAYRKKQAVNWCPSCKTVLADEQVLPAGRQGSPGKCERCGTVVIKKELEQWFFRITRYAERLLRNTETLDWSEKVKIAQRNWIGKSEGALIDFKIKGTDFKIEVFTTRPDTLFGATYAVLAPESPLITALELKIKNRDAVMRYVRRARGRAEADRIAEGREKTGVELKGVKAVNPATKKEIPVWVADYVLGHVGTGAIMAVPAHDERDHAFAKKYKLPITFVIEPETGAPQPNEEYRRSIVAIVEDPRAKRFLTLNWGPKLGGTLFIGGGHEKGEDEVKAALREIREETGYANLAFMGKTELMHHHYFAFSKKNVARNIEVTGLHFRLKSGAQTRRNLQHDEKGNFTIEWLTRSEIFQKMEDENHLLSFRRLVLGEIYTGAGKLKGSGKFDRMDSEQAKWAITKFVRGERTVRYRLRDWLISRQRYWGPPIPMIFCSSCAKAERGEQKEMPGWYAVPADDLPVKLPFVKDFRPKGKGVSPLASVRSFYEVKCPRCGAKARRETDVSDTFLDSAWYYLRYLDPKNRASALDATLVKKWLPVGMYIGGAEHSVLHLLYVRFVAMALHDWGLAPFSAKGGSASGGEGEPFQKFRAHGLLIKEGGKMSKSKGNVVNPDEYIKKFGADALRMYLMFLAPFEQGGDFRDQGILGITRFLERVWRFGSAAAAQNRPPESRPEVLRGLNRAIKKTTEDIEGLRYNTAISALMILLNELEKDPSAVSARTWGDFLKLLAPFAPHLTEELWSQGGGETSIHMETWPAYDPRLLKEDHFTLVIQVNGKVRDTVEVDAGIGESDARAVALARERVRPFLEGKKPKKVIYVPKRLVNIVV